jgi:methionyl-tRNA formyltransferase
MSRRLVYMGTPALAVPTLRALHEAGHEIVLVVTPMDAKRGRGGTLTPSPVKAAAEELGLKVSHNPNDVLETDAELGVVVAYGRLISAEVLARVPMVNLHFSLLPRWRGAAPVERALLAGDAKTGVCIMGLEETLDTGPVFACVEIPIDSDATLGTLRDQLVSTGTDLMVETLAGELSDPVRQVGEVTYAAKIDPADLHLDFSRSAIQLERVVRLGRAWTTFASKRLGIWDVEVINELPIEQAQLDAGQINAEGFVGTGGGTLRLVTVQPESKKRMAASDWLNGAQPDGETLG